MPSKPPVSQQVFNNADSFAQAFDEAWRAHSRSQPDAGLEAQEKLPLVLESIGDHPFLVQHRDLALQVAEFRIRLLGL